jgi:hypothetical protein
VARRTTRLVLASALASALGLGLLAGPATAEPTEEQLRAQEQTAARLTALAGDQQRETQSAQGRLRALADQSARAMERYVTATRAARRAQAREVEAQRRFSAAEAVVRTERSNLGQFASAAYRNGASMSDLRAISSLLEARSVTEMGRLAADLQYAGTQASVAVDRLIAAKRAAAGAAREAREARELAAAEQRRADAAKREADALVEQQEALVTTLAARAASTEKAADEASQVADRMRRARAIAEQRRIEAEREREAALQSGQVVQVSVPAGACKGRDLSGYANGAIPRDALCPLWGAAGHVLRADAAAAFSAMSKAYARTFGRPILVTDSYRSYEMQVACRRAKGSLCADPGTSNHGWGTAVDLADGIQSFGSSTHSWMRSNAPRFGWFLPGWAQEGGSKPEPWHWEFAG